MKALDFTKKYALYLINRNNRRDKNIWVFGEWFGKRTGDNCTHFANFVADHDPDIELYWMCTNQCDVSELDERIHIVHFSSDDCRKILKQAGVVLMGEGISDLNEGIINYCGNAIKVNLWHGIMWKKIGDDTKTGKGASFLDRIRDKMYAYDVFETPSDEYTKHILTGFRAGNKRFIKAGLPRNRLFYQTEQIEKCREKVLDKVGRKAKYIISYLPTFRDNTTDTFSFGDIKDAVFEKWMEDHDVIIIQKAHFTGNKQFSGENDRIIIMNDISAQELMAASDMLVTDYSSCFFDYLILDRPIIHHLYDYEYFRNKDRGLYYEKDKIVCGCVTETNEELIKEIMDEYDHPEKYKNVRKERKKQFMTYESQNSCEKIYNWLKAEAEKRDKQ